MKIQINVEKKYFLGILAIGLLTIGLVAVYAYSAQGIGGTPSQFGHSVNEMDWKAKIVGNVSADGFCIGTSCITSWPSGGGGDTKATQVGMLTGVLSDGGTIPLPSGFAESNCKWVVSPENPGNSKSGAGMDFLRASTSGRTVTCTYSYEDSGGISSATCNYLIICVK